MKKGLSLLAILISLGSVEGGAWEKTSTGLKSCVGDTLDVELRVYSPSTVRVIKTLKGGDELPKSLSVITEPDGSDFSVKGNGANATLSTSKLKVTLNERTGAITFTDKSGRQLIKEKGTASLSPVTDLGQATYKVGQTFTLSPKEQIYGLGSLIHDKMSRRNYTKKLLPGNIEDGFPVIQSSKGYGIFWDNYSPTLYKDDPSGMSFLSEVGDGVDYYFMYGGNADGVVAEMRALSGKVPMFPLWTYGYWQSRERYKSADETLGVVRKYRELGLPLDGIIQDWQYWGDNYLWNAMEFLNPGFRNAQEMIDGAHNLGAHAIISIWSSFGPMTKQFRELKDKGLLFDIATWPESGIDAWPPRKDYPSGVKVYNPYSSEARDIYWKHLSHLHDMGLDGWWMDSTEPDHFDSNMDFDTGMGSFRRVRGAFPLLTVGGVSDHQKNVDKDKRVFILTRSGWFGQQRYGCNVWTGDVSSTWDNLRRQIPSHLNMTLCAFPHVNSDLGGFFCGRYNLKDGRPANQNPLFGELVVRWTQLGAFTPMMRSHGTDCGREIYNFGTKGEAIYDALENIVRLRYSLLPYIYSTAWDVTANNGSFMRALVMDFPEYAAGLDCNDKFMFGRNLLVAPILKAHYTPETKTNIDENTGWNKQEQTDAQTLDMGINFLSEYDIEVSLPTGSDWYDFFTGEKHSGGKTAVKKASINTVPVFARAGAIVPMASGNVNYAQEKPWDNLTVKVFPGADGEFSLYEDEGDNYNYESGAYTLIPMNYDHKSGTLTIGNRSGKFDGMLTNRKFTVVNGATGTTLVIDYDGAAKSVKI